MLFRHGMEMARHRVGAGFRILAFKGIDDHQMLVDGFFHPPLQTDIVRAVVGKELVQIKIRQCAAAAICSVCTLTDAKNIHQ